MFGEGGVDDNQMVEILLVGLKFYGEEVAEQFHPFKLVVESAVLRVKKKPKHPIFSIFDFRIILFKNKYSHSNFYPIFQSNICIFTNQPQIGSIQFIPKQ